MRLNFSHETQLSSDFSVSLGCRSSNVYSVIRAFSVMIFNFFGLLVVHWHRPSTSLISASVTHPVLEDYRWNWFLCVRPYFSFWIRDFESPTRLWDWFHFPISRIPHKSSSVVFAVTCGNGFNFDRLHRLRLYDTDVVIPTFVRHTSHPCVQVVFIHRIHDSPTLSYRFYNHLTFIMFCVSVSWDLVSRDYRVVSHDHTNHKENNRSSTFPLSGNRTKTCDKQKYRTKKRSIIHG